MRKFQEGQALLVVLLSMVVILTIVLSVLSRSITDIAVSSRGEESIRAFSAAEAGVEQALVGQAAIGTFEGASYGVTSQKIGDGGQSFNYPYDIQNGDTGTIWFIPHKEDGSFGCPSAGTCYYFIGQTMNLCWGQNTNYPDANKLPALEISVYYYLNPGDPTTARIARLAVDPYTSRRSINQFAATGPGCTIDGTTYPFGATVDFSLLGIPSSVYGTFNGLQFAVVRFIYNSDKGHPFGVTSSGAGRFPSQGLNIESTGTSGEATRRVKVLRLYSDIPTPFLSVIFTPNGIVK